MCVCVAGVCVCVEAGGGGGVGVGVLKRELLIHDEHSLARCLFTRAHARKHIYTHTHTRTLCTLCGK